MYHALKGNFIVIVVLRPHAKKKTNDKRTFMVKNSNKNHFFMQILRESDGKKIVGIMFDGCKKRKANIIK
jgi:hypothetical protein